MPRWLWLLSLIGAAVSFSAWWLLGLTTPDTFLPMAVAYAGIGEEVARPIVERLHIALRIGSALGPWMLLAGWCMAVAVVRHREKIDRPLVFVGAVIVLSLLSLPCPVMPAVPGLDNSWQWLLNRLAFTRAFGRDTVFTYGPLGFLLCPQMPLVNVLTALCANILHSALWAFALVALYFSDRRSRGAAWLLSATLFIPQSNMEWRWVSLAVVLVAVPVIAPQVRLRKLILAFGGVVLALVSFMKFSSLVVVAGAQVFCLGAIVWRERRYVADLLPWGGAAAAVAGVIAAFSFDSVDSLLRWFAGSLAIASGYNKYMVLQKSWIELSVPFAAIAVTAFLLLWRNPSKRSTIMFFLMFSPVFFCAVKYALVRQGSFPLLYLLSTFCALTLCIVPTCRRRLLVLTGAFALATYVCTLPRALAGETFCHFAFGVNPMGIVESVMLSDSIRKAEELSAAKVEPYRLPEDWRKAIGSARVAFLPHEYAPAMGGDQYEMAVLPSFQLYSGYLPTLDMANAKLFADENSPQWIVCNVDLTWSGYFINYPLLWCAVLENYEVTDSVDKVILMKRKQRDVPATKDGRRTAKTEILRVSEWRNCDDLLKCKVSFEWKQSVLGKFSSVFLRNTFTTMEIVYDDGSHVRFQVLPENLTHAFCLSDVPSGDNEVLCILKMASKRKPRSFRFVAETPMLYGDRVVMRKGR